MKLGNSKLVTACCGVSLLLGAPAAAAAQTPVPASYSPWAALSAFAAPASSKALCGASAAAAAGAALQATSGCVFPTLDAPAPPPVAETAPIATPAAAVAGGVGVLPLLAGLAALGGIAALLLANGNEGGTQISISP